MTDRLSIRERPAGMPIMRQTWGKLLFLHWPFDVEALRAHVPERLQIDTHEGSAWVSVTPFTMWNVRPPYFPPLPYLSTTHELNVRTYVHLDGVPGVWFFSLDASNPFAVWGARLGFHLPYHRASMSLEEEGTTLRYRSRRLGAGAVPATFRASWSRGRPLPDATPGTLDFFLVERYCLYAQRGERLFRARIHHSPWPLQHAELHDLASTMLQAQGLTPPAATPLLHQQRAPLDVDVWRPELV